MKKIIIKSEDEILLKDVDFNNSIIGIHFNSGIKAIVIETETHVYTTCNIGYPNFNRIVFSSLYNISELINGKLYIFEDKNELLKWLMDEI